MIVGNVVFINFPFRLRIIENFHCYRSLAELHFSQDRVQFQYTLSTRIAQFQKISSTILINIIEKIDAFQTISFESAQKLSNIKTMHSYGQISLRSIIKFSALMKK